MSSAIFGRKRFGIGRRALHVCEHVPLSCHSDERTSSSVWKLTRSGEVVGYCVNIIRKSACRTYPSGLGVCVLVSHISIHSPVSQLQPGTSESTIHNDSRQSVEMKYGTIYQLHTP